MKYLFAYRRLCGNYIVCEWRGEYLKDKVAPENKKVIYFFQKCSMGYIKRTLSICDCEFKQMDRAPEALLIGNFEYRSVSYRTQGETSWVQMGKDSGGHWMEISQEMFDSQIEWHGLAENKIIIQSVGEYIQYIDYFRLVSLVEQVRLLASADPEGEKKFDTLAEVTLPDIESDQKTNSEVIVKSIRAILKKAKSEKGLSESTIVEIERVLKMYQNGGMFGYYRGVGRTIYPEQPSVFRDEYVREEDRWYREMKTQFQNDLEKKSYLDRLAMLQHYELPTRMLDVTTNPLVALYMTVNTLYTGDKEQSGTGEVIVYYNGTQRDDHSGDHYGNDIHYIQDGKAYDSGIVLVLAALAKSKYDNKERMRKVIKTFEYLIDQCGGEKWKKRDLIELVNRCVHASASHYEYVYHFSADEISRYRANYPDIINRRNCLKRADQVCDLLWGMARRNAEVVKGKAEYDTLEEFRSEYIKFISSYRYLLSTVRRENGAFRNHINIFDLLKSFHVKMGRTNDRIQAQSGSFIICGLDKEYIANEMISSRSKGYVRLFVKNKKKIANQLNAIGFNDSTMIPDMAHHAMYLKSKTKR